MKCAPVFLCLLLIAGCAKSKPAEKEASDGEIVYFANGRVNKEPRSQMLIARAHDEVLQVLKSPATARFSDDTIGHSPSKKQYTIHGSVDAQNSYGALLRNTYFVVLRETTGGRFELVFPAIVR